MGVGERIGADYDATIRICEQIVAIDPSVAKAHCNLGYVLNQTERYQEAIASLDRAIAI